MKIEFSKSSATIQDLAFAKKKPVYLGHTRLETQPTTVDLKAGLEAALADPLWMLSRQWQFNEFQGEDAGTPIKLSFAVKGSMIDRYCAGRDEAAAWRSLGEVPIETRVEAEPVWDRHPRLAGEAGLWLLRRAPNEAIRDALRQAYAQALPQPQDPEADRAGMLWSTLFDQRTLDGSSLRKDLLPLWGGDTLAGLPATLMLQPADVPATQALLESWMHWIDALVHEGEADNPAWQRDRMEYAFALSDGAVTLRSEEYTDGHLDWDDFQGEPLPPAQAGNQLVHQFAVAQRHPAMVRYPGMPAERYWEFEDGQVNFAGAEAGVTDLLRMSVTEFALSFGNDWFLVPVRLPVGGLYKVEQMQVTDTFGITATLGPLAAQGQARWSAFDITAHPALRGRLDHTVYIPDSLDGVQEGAVLEEVLLARDEMANLAWAIEKKVQGSSGEPLDRDMEAKALAFHQQIQFDTAPDSPQLVYRLATPVPANWTPLLPTRKSLNLADPLEIQLERAGMKRFYPEASVEVMGSNDPRYAAFLDLLDAQDNFITRLNIDAELRAYVFYPRGWMLRSDPLNPMDLSDRLLIEEEEIPRIGARLKRKFQFARSSDGRSWLWIGRSKVAGRGEASSGLRFDVAVKTANLR